MSRTGFVYDPATAAFQREMQAVYRTLRDEHPVYAAPDGAFVLSRFEDVWKPVNDWSSFSSTGVAEAAQPQPQMIYMDRATTPPCGGWSLAPSPRSGWLTSSPGCGRWPTSC
jgi:cytochrome P450